MKEQPTGQQFQQAKEKAFYLVKDKENKIIITLGGYAVSSKKFGNFEQANKYISCKPWEIILNSAAVILEKNEQLKQRANDTENTKNS